MNGNSFSRSISLSISAANWGFVRKNGILWQLALSPAGSVIVGKPFFRDKEPLIDKSVTIFGSVGRKDPDLTIVHFANVATVLAGDPDGVVSLFDATALIENQDAIGASEIVVYKTTVFDCDIYIGPRGIADKSLHRPD